MNELIAKIEQWAEERNIIKGSKPIDQAMKLFSEFGELADNVGKGRDCRDDIGDVFVVLTIMAKQTDSQINILSLPSLENLSLKQYVVELGFALNNFVFACDTAGEEDGNLDMAVMSLKRIAALHNTTLEECVQIAYNDIKERKGVVYNGVFIKESDPAYQDALDNIEADKRMASQKRISVNIEDL